MPVNMSFFWRCSPTEKTIDTTTYQNREGLKNTIFLSPSFILNDLSLLQRLNYDRRSPTAAIANGCHADLSFFLMQHVVERGHDPCAGSAEGVAQ